MRLFKKFLFLIFILPFFLLSTQSANAAPLCSPIASASPSNTTVTFDTSSASGLTDGTRLELGLNNQSASTTVQNKTAVFTFGKLTPGEYSFALFRVSDSGFRSILCSGTNAKLNVPDAGQGGSISNVRGSIEFSPSQPNPYETIKVIVKDLPKDGRYFISVSQGTNFNHHCINSRNKELSTFIGPLLEGSWIVYVAENKDQQESNVCQSSGNGIASANITISIPKKYDSKISSTPTPTPPPLPLNCVEGTYKDANKKEITTTDKKLMKKCTKIDTALGNFDIEPAGFITRVFGIILSLAGGIALILIIVSGYRLMTSQGNPEKVQAAREQLTSAIVGLLFIIFSVAILQIIGVDILRIPGFGR